MNEIINNVIISVKEYNGQRVVTFKDIDKVHNRPEGTARKRFNDNRKRFIEGEDYFKVCASEIRTNKIMDISPKTQCDVILVTESGYLMLVKSFTDELSWVVQRQLINTYFRIKETNLYNMEIIYEKLEVMSRKIDILEEKVDNIESHSYNLFREVIDAVIVPCFISLSNKIESTSEKSVKSVRTFRKRIDTLMKKIK